MKQRNELNSNKKSAPNYMNYNPVTNGTILM